MAVPNTGVTFSSIQTEFGGSNPVQLGAEYHKGGSYVLSNQATSSTDGNPISTSGAIRVGMFRGLSKTASSTWYRPTVATNNANPPTNGANAYDTGSTAAVNSSTYALYGANGLSAASVVYSGFSGSSSVTGTLYVSFNADGMIVDYGGGGESAWSINLSINGGSTWPAGYGYTGGATGEGGWAENHIGFSVPSLTVVPSSLRVWITCYGNGWAGSYANIQLYDVVFVVA
jgi:hypothetical protein